MAQGRSEKVINGGEKLRFVTYSMDQENKVSKIYLLYLYCVSDGFWNVFYSRRMASNWFVTFKAKQVNLNIVFKLLTRFNTQFSIYLE